MYYFIGIKGSGMASLATILFDLGHEVAGSDIDKFIFTENELRKRNISIYSFNKENIKDGYHVIIGNAFDESNEEVLEAKSNPHVITHTYYDFLGELMNQYVSIAIAGTHGKTTTTGMAYHLFNEYDKTSVLIGDGTGHGVKDSKYFISETCEYKDHFLHYYPTYAVINNIELDHVDYFSSIEQYCESFEKFANQVKDTVIIWGDDPYLNKLNYTKRVLKFGIGEHNDIKATNIINNHQGLSFDVYIHNELFGHFALPFYGMHMLYDSLAVITIGYLENMDAYYIQKRLSTFEGVKRRYSVKEINNNIYVDDYAHHPTAIEYVIEATRSRYPDKQIVAVFQPDRFSRGAKFAKEFADALNKADYPFLMHFPDNAKKEDGIDIDIYDIAKYIPRAIVIKDDEDAVSLLAKHDNVVFLFMSSKDIYKLQQKVIDYKSKVE